MKRIKSTFSIVLALVMLLAVLPLGVFQTAAITGYGVQRITIAGTTYENPNDSTVFPTGVSWDQSTDTLTLNGYNGGYIALEAGGANPDSFSVTVKLIGENSITTYDGYGIDGKENAYAALYSQGEMTITGDEGSSLFIGYRQDNEVNSYGIFVNKQDLSPSSSESFKDLTINGECDVKIKINMYLSDRSSTNYGVYAGNVNVNDSAVLDIYTMQQDVDSSDYCVHASNKFNINTDRWVCLYAESSGDCSVADSAPILSKNSSIYLYNSSDSIFGASSLGVEFAYGVNKNNFKEYQYVNYWAYISEQSAKITSITAADIETPFPYPANGQKLYGPYESDKFDADLKWYTNLSVEITDKNTVAEAGKTYKAGMYIVPKAGYKIDGSLIITETLNAVFENRNLPMSTAEWSTNDGKKGSRYIEGYFNTESATSPSKTIVSNIEIAGISNPVVGEKAVLSHVLPADAVYELDESEHNGWFNQTDYEELSEDDVFEAGKRYGYMLNLKIKDSTQYVFDSNSNLSIKINGIVPSTKNSIGETLYIMSMSFHVHEYTDWKYDNDKHWKECTDGTCDEVFNTANHTSSDWIIDKAATTSEEGAKHKECTVCNYVLESETIDKLTPVHVHSYSSDWKTDNNKHWKECSCGAKAETANHASSDWIIDKVATTAEAGVKHKECTVCKYVLESETIDKLTPVHVHSYSSDWKTDNNKHWKECSCAAKAEAANHTSSDWIIDKAATTSEEGAKHKECTVCKYVIVRETIAKIAEKPVAKLTETTTAKSAETTTAKSAETTTAKSAETTTAKSAETTTAKSAETTTAKSAETTTAKSAETTTAKSAETTTAKPAETTTAKFAETTTTKSAETTTAKQPETTTAKPAETTTTKADEKLEFAENANVEGNIDEENKKVSILPKETKGITLDDFKAMFKSAVSVAEEKIEKVYNGMKLIFNGNEYTFIFKGDVNADGKISASDARTILRIAAKLEQPDEVTKESADINFDDKVTSKEARSVLRFAAKLQKEIYE